MSLSCDEYLLQSHVDGQLTPEEAEAVVAHCRVCEPCRRLLGELELVCAGLQVECEAAPSGLQQRLLAAVSGLQPLRAITCAEAQEWVSLRLDGELSHEQIQRLQAHLEACGSCHVVATQTDLATQVLRQVGEEAAPAGLLERVQVAAQLAAGEPRVLRPAWRRWSLSLGGVAAAAALLLALLTRLGPVPPPGPVMVEQPRPGSAVAVAGPAEPAERVAVARPASVAVEAVPSRPLAVVSRLSGEAGERRVAPAAPRTAVPSPAVPALAPAVSVPSPRVLPHEISGPVTVALAPVTPTAPERIAIPSETPRTEERPVPMAPRVSAPAAVVERVPEAPQPTRVATAEPARAEAAPKPARTRASWVSRTDEGDREIYASTEMPGNRLAMARRALDRDATTIRNSRIREFVIH